MEPISAFIIIAVLSIVVLIVLRFKYFELEHAPFVASIAIFVIGVGIIGFGMFTVAGEVADYSQVGEEPLIVKIREIHSEYVVCSTSDWGRVWKIGRAHIEEIPPFTLHMETFTDSLVTIRAIHVEGATGITKPTIVQMSQR